MRLKQLADAALATFPPTSIERGQLLAEEVRETSLTLRIDDGRQVHSVVWDFSAVGSRAACTCGGTNCEHAAAVLSWLTRPDRGRPSLIPPSARDDEPSPEHSLDDHDEDHDAASAELGQSIATLVQRTWRYGLSDESAERDQSLKELIEQLQGVDNPDVKRLVAILRRNILTANPNLAETAHTLVALERWAQRQQPDQPGTESATQGARTEWKQEMRLLEVARSSQRTPYGDRREVSFFLDLDGGGFYREVAVSQSDGSPPVYSEGPFPKRLLGNLVELEQGPPPQRIRMLQYSSAGFATAADIEQIRGASTREVATLYRSFRQAVQEGRDHVEQFVLYSPRYVHATKTGIILADDHGALLPLARRQTPALCAALDHIAHEQTIVAVAGVLIPSSHFLSLLPLSVVVPSGNRLRLRRIR